MAVHRYLTKSRFKLATECGTKLHYTGDPEYFNSREDNSFLAALAEGGFQVGALACLMLPGGVMVEERDAEGQLARTHELLQRDEVVIYEATLAHEGKLVRVDLMHKQGRTIDLIEVKAKSYSPGGDADFRAARAGFKAAWLPYLLDIAYQHHVAGLALPGFEIQPWLMLANKEARATVNGLGQAFKLRRQGRQMQVELAPGIAERLGEPLLIRVPVSSQVAELQAGTLRVGDAELPFAEAVQRLGRAGRGEIRIPGRPSQACGTCEFRRPEPPAAGQPRSGFHECWRAALGWSDADFADPLVLDLWNGRRKAQWLEQGLYKLKQLHPEDLGADAEAEPALTGLSTPQRQWMQCSEHGQWTDHEGLRQAMASWRYPLNFIDFETAMLAIPYQAGRRPYEVTAFQFSHHQMDASGRVVHAAQFLDARPGQDPNRGFVRALQRTLEGNAGTVLRWSHHENNVLNALYRRFEEEQQPGDDELMAFIASITHDDGREAGPRNMVDLCELAQRFFYAPGTRGSSSLKKVLPALMRSSPWLRNFYGLPVYGSPAMPSLNLQQPMAWWVAAEDGKPLDPYDLLPRVFDDLDASEMAGLDAGLDNDLQEGGAAMIAYARLQQEAMPEPVRDAIQRALLRYCELDTLAMVMAVQAWTEASRPA
ncbi:DUF2779 domain-containing protein [Pelomonas sp. SE-A7]|uniref:DUF2779 domain-containing protein n=1 Tax=Pelomonas sp. SE-A7 TaxID=3054953 RepID=UPI00259CB9CC|nr:DUF2779 domain-containing protein [Pelomonas sp. SE-A7]MDM4765241.1 DUF2779 domain-containing protein [Pelomonas sp. SE-A7]